MKKEKSTKRISGTDQWKAIQKAGSKISPNTFNVKQKLITASQAKENVKKVGGSLNSILDDISGLIETLSGRGFTKITYSTNNIEGEKLKLKVIRKLKKLGYKVELDELGIFWQISW